jgi:ABC-2 type transport system permease protein
MNQMAILLRRELWENRAITAAPAVIGGLLVLIALLAVGGAISIQVGEMPYDLAGAVRELEPREITPLLQVGLMSVGVFFNSVMIFVISFYLLDSLYADRKDRSILFWKSLPVSDTTIVLSKLATAAIVIPVVTLVVFLLTAVALWLVGGGAAAVAGNMAALARGPGVILQTGLTFVYALFVQSLWYLPLFGWLLLASAWAKRGVLWWAVLPPVALIMLEDLVFDTHSVARAIGERLTGVFPLAFRHQGGVDIVVPDQSGAGNAVEMSLPDNALEAINPGPLLTDPGLWGGFVLAAIFIAGAIWLRRYRDET